MSEGTNAPTIVRRKKVINADGHHGGAWKVAYADFVTAMMAFFLLMWLLGATNEKQRKGIADFFNPTIPVNRVSGGGDGAFGGDSVFSEQTLAQNGTGAGALRATSQRQARGDTGVSSAAEREAAEARDAQQLSQVDALLNGRGGESYVSELLARHIVTRLTDEGLVVEFFDLPNAPLFLGDTSVPTNVLDNLLRSTAEIFALVDNEIAVNGHVAATPVVIVDRPVWDISTDRADRVRRDFKALGLQDLRFNRVAGFADSTLAVASPLAVQNTRIEDIQLRKVF